MKLTKNILSQAMQEFNSGNYATTISKLEAVYKHHPMAEMLYATALGKTGQFDKSFTIFKGLQKKYPKNPDVSFNYALLLRQANKLSEAEQQLLYTLDTSPNYHVAHHAFGNLMLDLFQEPEAILAFDKAHRLEPSNSQYIQSLSKALYRQAEWKKLIELLERKNHFTLDQACAEFYAEACYRAYARAKLFMQRNKLTTIFPKSFALNYFIGLSELESKRYGVARTHLESAKTLVSNDEQLEELNAYSAFIDWLIAPKITTFSVLTERLYSTNNIQLLDLAYNIFENKKDVKHAEYFLNKLQMASDDQAISQLPLKRALLAYSNQDFNLCIELLDSVLKAQPLSLTHLYLKIRVLDKQKRFSEAEQLILFIAKNINILNSDKFNDLKANIEIAQRTFDITPAQISVTSSNETNILFIVGFPRSGTTLIENQLLKFKDVTLLEETESAAIFCKQLMEKGIIDAKSGNISIDLGQEDLDLLADEYLNHVKNYAPALNTRGLIIDKMPLNFPYLPTLLTIFPNAKVLCCVRHPKAIALSSLQFEEVNLYTAERFIKAYDIVFSCWERIAPMLGERALNVKYEDVVRNYESTMNVLTEFIDLSKGDIDDGRTDHHALVQTPSYFQVNEPIYDYSLTKFENYSKLFDETSALYDYWEDKWGYK